MALLAPGKIGMTLAADVEIHGAGQGMTQTSACLVMTTAPDQQQAETIVKAVISERLAACAQTQPINSFYWWDGKIINDGEILIYFKTTKERYSVLEQAILAIHPYDTPEIILLPIEAGSSGYLSWIAKETAG
jgi:periplasmic divalent cation tolerance protein